LSRFGPGNANSSLVATSSHFGSEKTALEMADAIIAVSDATKHDIERLFNVDPARVHVIHNGIDLNQYRKVDSTGALKRYGIDRPSHICFLWDGSRARKGFSIWCAQSNSWIAISRSCCVQPLQTRRNWRGNADCCRTRRSAAAGNHLDQ
jgi:glycosyltransferase involved in cell wall biosynthesis